MSACAACDNQWDMAHINDSLRDWYGRISSVELVQALHDNFVRLGYDVDDHAISKNVILEHIKGLHQSRTPSIKK